MSELQEDVRYLRDLLAFRLGDQLVRAIRLRERMEKVWQNDAAHFIAASLDLEIERVMAKIAAEAQSEE